MSGTHSNVRLVFTNDRVRNSMALKVISVLFLLIGAAAFIGPVWNWWVGPANKVGNVALVVVGTLFGGICVLAVRETWMILLPAAWEIDDHGMTYQGPRGPRRRLLWNEVRRVRMNAKEARLVGEDIKIRLDWGHFQEATRLDVTRTLLAHLAPYFNLPTGSGKMGVFVVRALGLGPFVSVYIYCAVRAAATGLNRLLPWLEHVAIRDRWDAVLFALVAQGIFGGIYFSIIAPLFVWLDGLGWTDRKF